MLLNKVANAAVETKEGFSTAVRQQQQPCRRRYHSRSSMHTTFMVFVSIILLLMFGGGLPLVNATLSVGNYSFESMPGMFGLPWRPDTQYRAHLQFLVENPYLCDYPIDDGSSTSSDAWMMNSTDLSNSGSSGNIGSLVTPTDGVPVALLAKRGNCSFGQKAKVAMAYRNSRARVQFCIVYDDEPRASLIAMQAVDYDSFNADIHTLFVSLVTGVQLRAMIQDQPSNTNHGGLIVGLNSESPMTPYYYNEGQQWLVAAMAGFFGFVAFFGCLLVAVHAGYLPMEGNRIYFGNRHTAGSIRIPGGRPLLTCDQVSQLRQVQHRLFQEGGEEHHDGERRADADTEQLCCSICMEDYEHGEYLIELPCSHRFHKECIEPWLTERHASCPLCKLDMLGHLANQHLNNNNNNSSRNANVCDSTTGGNGTTAAAATSATTGGGTAITTPTMLLTRLIRMGWTPVATTNTENSDDTSAVVVITDDHLEEQGQSSSLSSTTTITTVYESTATSTTATLSSTSS